MNQKSSELVRLPMIPLLQRFAWLCDIDGPGWVSVMEVLVEIDRCHQLPEWCAWQNGAERPVVTSLACGTELVGPPHMVLLVIVAVWVLWRRRIM